MFEKLKKIGKIFYLDYYRDVIFSSQKLLLLKVKYHFSVLFFKSENIKSNLPIDIVIPVIDKDSVTLPYVIDSARKYVKHPISNIFLVSPKNSEKIKQICETHNCIFIEEENLLPLNSENINYSFNGHNKSKWMYQQLLKLSPDTFVKEKNYLILDSDTVLIYPVVFENEGKIIFDFCDEFHIPYFRAFKKLFFESHVCPVSFTSHHTLINIEKLNYLKQNLESLHAKKWYACIVDIIDQNEASCHSDYETYAQFLFLKYRNDGIIQYWYNKSLPRREITNLDNYEKKYRGKYKTLSFHSHRI